MSRFLVIISVLSVKSIVGRDVWPKPEVEVKYDSYFVFKKNRTIEVEIVNYKCDLLTNALKLFGNYKIIANRRRRSKREVNWSSEEQLINQPLAESSIQLGNLNTNRTGASDELRQRQENEILREKVKEGKMERNDHSKDISSEQGAENLNSLRTENLSELIKQNITEFWTSPNELTSQSSESETWRKAPSNLQTENVTETREGNSKEKGLENKQRVTAKEWWMEQELPENNLNSDYSISNEMRTQNTSQYTSIPNERNKSRKVDDGKWNESSSGDSSDQSVESPATTNSSIESPATTNSSIESPPTTMSSTRAAADNVDFSGNSEERIVNPTQRLNQEIATTVNKTRNGSSDIGGGLSSQWMEMSSEEQLGSSAYDHDKDSHSKKPQTTHAEKPPETTTQSMRTTYSMDPRTINNTDRQTITDSPTTHSTERQTTYSTERQPTNSTGGRTTPKERQITYTTEPQTTYSTVKRTNSNNNSLFTTKRTRPSTEGPTTPFNLHADLVKALTATTTDRPTSGDLHINLIKALAPKFARKKGKTTTTRPGTFNKPKGELIIENDDLDDGFLVKGRKPMLKQANSNRNKTLKKEDDFEKLMINLTSPCEALPHVNMIEKYILNVSAVSRLESESVWGIIRGLYSFNEMIYDEDNERRINKVDLEDGPRYKHRGLMLDTAIHYVPVKTILKTLDAMAMNKMNVFHWHIVDDESFPFVSEKFPLLSEKGAYCKKMIYNKTDISTIIKHATIRGIRVVPEFTVPGHTGAWGKGYPNLLTKCYSGKHVSRLGPMNPIRDETYSFLADFFKEVENTFPDKFIYFGGNEIDMSCWNSNPEIVEYISYFGVKSITELLILFMRNLLPNFGNQTEFIFSEDIFQANVPVPAASVIQLWKKPGWDTKTYAVLWSNQRVIITWNLEDESNFMDIYNEDPRDSVKACDKDPRPCTNILGGEVSLLGNMVNNKYTLLEIWQKISTVADLLWSNNPELPLQNSDIKADIKEHVCFMTRSGLPVKFDDNNINVCH